MNAPGLNVGATNINPLASAQVHSLLHSTGLPTIDSKGEAIPAWLRDIGSAVHTGTSIFLLEAFASQSITRRLLLRTHNTRSFPPYRQLSHDLKVTQLSIFDFYAHTAFETQLHDRSRSQGACDINDLRPILIQEKKG